MPGNNNNNNNNHKQTTKRIYHVPRAGIETRQGGKEINHGSLIVWGWLIGIPRGLFI
jgi:hypothetical protein